MLKSETNGKTKLALVESFDKVLSLDLLAHAAAKAQSEQAEEESKQTASEEDAWIEELIAERTAAKKEKNLLERTR